jgi:hypothetical protein
MFVNSPMLAPGAEDGVLALLRLLATPDAAKQMLADLASARDAATAEISKLTDLQIKHAALAKEREAHIAEVAAERQRIRDERDALASDRADLVADQQEHKRKIEALNFDRADFERQRRQHAERLDEVAKLKRLLGG